MEKNLLHHHMPSNRLRKIVRTCFLIMILLTIVNVMEEFTFLHSYMESSGNGFFLAVSFVLWVVSIIASVLLSYLYWLETKNYENYFGINDQEALNLLEHDDLTGLYLRHAAIEHLRKVSPKLVYTDLILDIDSFKEINDVYGHEFGDHLLINMAEKIKSYTEKYDCLLSRYGSDDFLIVVFGRHVEPDSEFINKLRELIHRPIEIGLANIVPTVCIGIAYSDGCSSGQDILKHADIAVNESKKHGFKYVTVYNSDMEKRMVKRYDIKKTVYQAIDNDGFYMVYQPKVRASDQKLVGFEALVRMKDQSYSPADFIPVAEENGWLRQIGRITTEKVICQLAKWKEAGYSLYPVSINYSTVQIRDTEYFSFLLQKLKQYHIPAKCIEIEITESILIEHMNAAVQLIDNFRQAGIRVLLDDFGTGYSSLSYLNSIALDAIKVDKRFVAEYLDDDKKKLMMRDIIQLGHDIGAEIIIEGVEQWDQFVHLKELGADVIQGFVFSKPLDPDQAIRFVPGVPADKP